MKRLFRNSLLLVLAAVLLLLPACTFYQGEYGSPAAAGEPSPGSGGSGEPAPTPTPASDDAGKLVITELMVRNRATIQDADGDFPDYIELQNHSGAALSTAGWSLAEGEMDAWLLPELTLQPDELLLVFASGKDRRDGEYHASFSLSQDETLQLRTPSGYISESVLLSDDSRDTALVRQDDGSFSPTRLSSPGYPNGREGNLAFLAGRKTDSPVVIQEVMVSNQSYARQSELGYSDWVELKNVSGETVELSAYALSDGDTDYSLAAAGSLEAGRTLLVYCDKDEAGGVLNTGFGLSPNSDRVLLKCENAVVDYLYLHDIPVNDSYGRLTGQEGFFYFTVPTPNEDNGSPAYRFVSEKPEGARDGVYENVGGVTVDLSTPGTIYYTVDGTVPTAHSPVYTGPFEIGSTTIVRAVSVEEDAAPSRVLTLSYILNEGHKIPVLSLVADDYGAFNSMYRSGYLNSRIPCVLSLYEEGGSFTQAGGLGLAGAGTRTKYPKKSLSVKFSGKYGDGDLKYDLFGTGIDEYDAVTLHVGEDYVFTVFRTDLFQNLALAMGGNAVAQHTKFCALYVNGEYKGLFGLKERWTEKFYADLMGVSEESVEILKYPVELTSSFYLEVIQFCRENSLADPANYQHFCELVNVDSLIDWYLLEGLAGNPDIGGNMRVLRTTEGADTRWRFGIYDLDWSMRNTDSIFTTFYNNNDYHYGQIYAILSAAWKNPDFMDRLLKRYAEVWDTVLSNESIVGMIDEMADEIRDEMPRERSIWGDSNNNVANWERNVNILRSYILDNDLQHLGVRRLCQVLGVSDAQRAQYFGW